MSSYYDAKGVTFERVRNDLKNHKISGIKIDKTAENTKDSICITDGESYVWISPGMERNSLGLKRWGGNDEENFIDILQTKYKIRFRDEEELGVIHIG